MTGYFEEAEGQKSIMRLNSSLAVYIGLGLSILQGVLPLLDKAANNFDLIIVLFSYGFGAKAIQKFAEK